MGFEQIDSIDTLTRDEFLEEFISRMEPGQHSIFLGPTGRGKSTLMHDLLELGPPFDYRAILSPKGPDKAFADLANSMIVHSWPGNWRREIHRFGSDPPWTWQLVGNPKAGFAPLHAQFEPPLQWIRGRGGWLLIIPDLQAMADRRFAGLMGELEWLVLTLRSAGSSVWMDAQRPAWIPRASADQVSNVIVFRNSDLGTVERLREIISLPMAEMKPLMRQLRRHDFLWYDGLEDELMFVLGDKGHPSAPAPMGT